MSVPLWFFMQLYFSALLTVPSIVDKLADYEDELRRLKSVQSESAHTHSASGSAPLPTPPGSEPTGNGPLPGRFSSLLGSRKPSTSTEPLPQPSSRRESDLQAALAREQSLRQQAEGKVTQMDKEIEDLSVTLFQQANEMVAKERKARAKLEERVETLEKRDVEKRKRLERLESAVKRIDRVNKLLAP